MWQAFGGTREPNSTKSHDITDADGRRLQVKSRVVSEQSQAGQQQTSVFRSWDFDFAVLVQLAERDYSVVRAVMVPVELFAACDAHARWTDHVRGWNVFMSPALMDHAQSIDVTSKLQLASSSG